MINQISRNLNSKFLSAINTRFKVLDVIDLFDYDEDMWKLHAHLKKLKQEEYQANEKIVFLHFDTDFYLQQDQPGFTIQNLHLILADLDIPFAFTLLITNHYGISQQLKSARIGINPSEPKSLPCIETNFQDLLINDGTVVDIKINPDRINYQYSCLNRSKRSHRAFLLSLLKSRELLVKGLVSYHD